ncbi:MAG TPA: hypothetical protein VFG72_03900 [Marmoricola sp.]|nr:hypothetical protein [Marmoricola sp.]
MSTTPAIPPEYTALVDDAAIFPPGEAPLEEAVPAHREHLAARYAGMVGPFVVSDTRLPDLAGLVDPDGDPLRVTVVVTGGAGAIEPAYRWATSPGLEPAGIEVALRDLDDLAGSARRVVAAVTQLGTDVPTYVEPPLVPGTPAHGWLAALDEVASADLRLKLRTGGVTADAFPSEETVATAIDAALDRELPFKCTAGLHHAVRHRSGETGFEHHGFLNVLLATRAALDGDDVVAALAERDADAVVSRLVDVGSDGLVRARRWFTSFGCCGVREPYDDLVALSLVPA